MTSRRRVAMIAMVLGVFLGCAQNRIVQTPMTHDMMAGAPKWATANGKESTDDKLYFVGISQEQVLGESEAVSQAYMDAVRRVSDALGGLAVKGTDSMSATAGNASRSKWPHQSSARLGTTGALVGGPAAYAMSNGTGDAVAGIGGAGIGYIKRPQYKRVTRAGYCNELETAFIREQVISNVSIVDTWTVSERFSRPREAGQVNEMQYGELWKAKVLVSVPKKVMDEVAQMQYKMRCRELDQEFAVRKTESDLQFRELEADLDIRKRSAELRLDRPTFHFMNNAYWYGNDPSRGLFTPRRVDVGEFDTENPARILK